MSQPIAPELVAESDGQVMELDSTAEHVARYEDVRGRHLVRFGARDDLVCAWRRDNGEPGTVQEVPDAPETSA